METLKHLLYVIHCSITGFFVSNKKWWTKSSFNKALFRLQQEQALWQTRGTRTDLGYSNYSWLQAQGQHTISIQTHSWRNNQLCLKPKLLHSDMISSSSNSRNTCWSLNNHLLCSFFSLLMVYQLTNNQTHRSKCLVMFAEESEVRNVR